MPATTNLHLFRLTTEFAASSAAATSALSALPIQVNIRGPGNSHAVRREEKWTILFDKSKESRSKQ
jgi:hypothetical protein